MKFRVALISTGGTIEKTYDELSGVLDNQVAVLDVMLSQLKLGGVSLHRNRLMNKDSLHMTDADHSLIAMTALENSEKHDGVVIVHGTDRLAATGNRICECAEEISSAIVLTGAMRPYEMRNTDALQNLTESFLAVQLLPPGVYVAMHNRVLQFPGVRKDSVVGEFVKD